MPEVTDPRTRADTNQVGASHARLEIQWRRGSYCAKLDGPDDKWRTRREFEQGTPVKSRSALIFSLEPGYYETREGKDRESKQFWSVQAGSLEPRLLPDTFDLASHVASAGPLPGTPGAWNSDQCKCGADTAGLSEFGMPYCAKHAPTASDQGPEEEPF